MSARSSPTPAAARNQIGGHGLRVSAAAMARYQIAASQRYPRGRMAEGPITGMYMPSCMVAPNSEPGIDRPPPEGSVARCLDTCGLIDCEQLMPRRDARRVAGPTRSCSGQLDHAA